MRLMFGEKVCRVCSGLVARRLIALSVVVATTIVASGCGESSAEEPQAGLPALTYVGPQGGFCDSVWPVQGPKDGISARLVLGRLEPEGDRGMSFKVENLGAQRLVHGSLPFIDRWIDGRWIPQKLVNGRGVEYGFSLKAFGVGPGELGQCVWAPLPKDWAPGRYRLSFPVDTFADRGEPSELMLQAEFVLGP